FNAANGAMRWKVRLNGEVLAPAAISERLIAVRTVDGKLHALSPADGHELWSQEQQVPRLSLRGTARPVIAGDLVLCGFDNGKVIALKARTGAELWRQKALLHRGLSKLATMDDAVVVGDFQGYVHWLDKSSGALAARVSTGKTRISTAPVVAGNTVVVVNDRGQVSAFRVTPLARAPATDRRKVPETPAPTREESQ